MPAALQRKKTGRDEFKSLDFRFGLRLGIMQKLPGRSGI